jgi:Putative Ig domain
MRRITLSLFVLLACSLQAQVAAQLEIAKQQLPIGTVGREYSAKLNAVNRQGPLVWNIRGDLPPGLRLNPGSGVLSGTPSKGGNYKVVITVLDRSTGATAQRDFTIEISGLLRIEWKQPPSLSGKAISGKVTVSNASPDTYDLTFIVYAINEVGKAFALGYQRFNLRPSQQQDLPFGLELPNGQYVVHADAVGEVALKNIIRRAALDTPERIAINVNR